MLDERLGTHVRRVDLTQVEESESLLWDRVVWLGKLLRAEGVKFEWAGCYEVGPAGGHGHVHLVCWGDYIGQAHLEALWSRCCGYEARVWIRAAVRGAEDAAYVLKGVGRYVTKGGRRVHYSRGFSPWAVRVREQLARSASEGRVAHRTPVQVLGPHGQAALEAIDAWYEAPRPVS